MAIALEFIDFVVQRTIIDEKYPGGWQACLNDHRSVVGGRVWYDDYLFRDGAMNPGDIESIADRWTRMGFEGQVEVDGELRWKDFCVVEAMFGGTTLPCDWIEVDQGLRIAYLTGTPVGDVSGPVGR